MFVGFFKPNKTGLPEKNHKKLMLKVMLQQMMV